jgi:hypothetical protein
MGRITEFIDYINREPGNFPEGYRDSLAYIIIDDNLKRIRRRHGQRQTTSKKRENEK